MNDPSKFMAKLRPALATSLIGIVVLFIAACQLLPTTPPQEEDVAGSSSENIFSQIFPGQPIPDEIATKLMYDLYDGSEGERNAAVEAIMTSQDERFVPVLIELQRFAQIGVAPSEFLLGTALERLSRQNFGDDWASWIEWYGGTDLAPPPGFTSWKGRLLSQIDPGFGEFLQDGFDSTIRVEEIQWGGVRVDGIPALDHSQMIAADEADYITPEEPVFGLEINGDARAYPLRILDWHEMANDTVGDVPVSIAYCTLCGAAIAYDGRGNDGETYDFGSSGFLFRSNKLMYDRQTRTLWNQMSGEPVLGTLVGSDVKLDILPIVLTTWESWLEQHPDTVVLDINTGHVRPYEVGSAYGDYFAAEETMFPVWQRSDLLDTKDRVYAMQIENIPVAYPINAVTEEGVINDTVGETNIVVVGQRNILNVTGNSRREGEVTYSAGSEIRAYDRGELEFLPGPSPEMVLDSDGQAWTVTEEALIAANGTRVERLGGHLAYWFGWFAFFPDTLVYGAE